MFLYDDKEFLGKKIKQLRINAKLSQAELSERIGMTEKNLSNIERGLQIPALNSFLKILDILNVSLSEFGISTEKTKNETRDELIKEIYLANTNEIEAYLQIIKTIKNIK
ncbi:helix-turn-helix transcriptional regulator [bacterium]|nr:helix-turn-helix transcriptional regulator [bacterium]